MIYITIKLKNNSLKLQNKVATRCDLQKENVDIVARKVVYDMCEMDRVSVNNVDYDIFIKNDDTYYKLVKEI